MADSAQQLQDLVATPRVIRIRDREISLRPPRPFTDEFVKILRLVGPLAPHFAGETLDVGVLLAEHGEKMRPLCALLSGQDEAWLKQLEVEEAVQLITALVEENLDFFARRLVPALANASSGLAGKWSTVSQTTSAPVPTSAPTSAGSTPPSS